MERVQASDHDVNATARPRTRGRRAPDPTPASVPEARPARYSDLGQVPEDHLKANEWMHRALAIAAGQVVHEPNLTEKERRRELCDLAARMADLTPTSKLSRAQDIVLNGAGGAASSTPGASGPVMERVDYAPEEVAVGIPASGPAARRGRPRKRSIR